MKPPYHGQKVRLSSPNAACDAVGYFVMGSLRPLKGTRPLIHFLGSTPHSKRIGHLYVYTNDVVEVLR